MNIQHRRIPWTIIILTDLGVFIIAAYLYTLCPSVYLIDSGELASVSYTLGIAHPTGYPLYTILSYLFTSLPGDPVNMVNLFSALVAMIAALIVYLIAYRLTHDKITAILFGILYAFAPMIWRIAVTNEVYSLTATFVVLIILILLRPSNTRSIFFLLYCIGLALANHVIIFSLVLPVIIYVIIIYRPKIKFILYGLSFCLAGLSLYCYLIARTNGGALLAWGGAYNLERLVWHVTGKQYQVWMFTLSFNEIINNFFNGIGLLARNFQYIFLIPVFTGFVHLYRTERPKFWLFSSVVFINMLYAANYSIPDIESYYIPAFSIMVIAAIYGITLIKRYLKWYVVIPVSILIILVNYNACSLRHNTFAYDFSRAHIEQLPPNSLVICTFWDIYSPTLYFQHVQKIRTDLVIIDKELLRRTWYIRYLERAYPEFYEKVRTSVDTYMSELYKFEYGKPYNSQVIQARFVHMLQTFINQHLIEANVYLAMPYPDNDLSQIKVEHSPVPYGFVIQILQDTSAYQPFDFSRLTVHNPAIAYDERLVHNRDLIKRLVQGNINYLLQHHDTIAAMNAQKWFDNFNDKKTVY